VVVETGSKAPVTTTSSANVPCCMSTSSRAVCAAFTFTFSSKGW